MTAAGSMAPPVIELRGVCKAFGRHRVIEGLDLAVPAQSVFAFLGNNGAGKSTTIRLITGLLRPDRGTIGVLGMDVQTQRRAVLAQVGALVDAPSFYPNLTADEFLRIGCTLKNLPRSEIGRVLELVAMTPARGRLIATYSLGMKQRLALAHALLGAPRLLILDEPSNGLDPEGKRDMRALLASLPAQAGSTVFVSSHNLDEIEKIATHVAVLKGGALQFQGSLAQLQARHAGVLAIDVTDAAHAVQLLAAANYQAERQSGQQVVVRGIELQCADKVHALLVHAGVGIFQSVHHTPSLEQWFLEGQCEN
jgi:ABC-2 type transport system ATP-binding protein